MTTREVVPASVTLAPLYADMTPAQLVVAWSYWSDAADRRVWCFPHGGWLLGLNRERFELVRDALIAYFDRQGLAMEWMRREREA